MGANGQIGVGIIGCGDGGRSNARGLQGIKETRIVALCDVNGERLAAAVQEFGGAGYTDFTAMLDDPNVQLVIVATPDYLHYEPVQIALTGGKHVFVDKPVATEMDDLEKFSMLSRRHRGRLWFGENHSHASPVGAALLHRGKLGRFLWGTTFYTMQMCGRIMGPECWRVHTRYNPCAGGLSHNFMTALLFTGSRIVRVRASGQVLTYGALMRFGGFDTMRGTLEFENGMLLDWVVCLAIEGQGSLAGHRSVAHVFQFSDGAFIYGLSPEGDQLSVRGQNIAFDREPVAEEAWWSYFVRELYGRMHRDILAAIREGKEPCHTIEQGINVAAACVRAFESAHQDGAWLEVSF